MLRSGLDIPVDDLSVDAQAQLAKELANLQFVERNLLTEVIEEFSSEVTSIGLNLRGGAAQTLNLLEGKISTETAERLRKEAGVRKFSDPWDRLNISDIDDIDRHNLGREHRGQRNYYFIVGCVKSSGAAGKIARNTRTPNQPCNFNDPSCHPASHFTDRSKPFGAAR